jgi:DNA-binding LacI/PurR family transcriptional regulator
VASGLGYEANPHAQRLANGGVNNMVAIFAGIDLGIATLRLWQVQGQLNEMGYITDVHLMPSYVSQQEQRQISILRDLRRLNPAAIVSQSMGLDKGALAELQQYQDRGGILVTFDDPIDLACDQVVFDQVDSTYQAAIHLLDMGHRAINYCQASHHDPHEPRRQGVCRALRERGVAPLLEQLCYVELNESGGRAMAERYFALKKKPTAIISNDAAAAVLMHALIRRGVRVPEELSVVGYDDTLPAQTAIVPITSVAYPVKEVGRHVADLVQSRLNGLYKGPPRRIDVKGELVQRESVAPPA